MKLVELLQPTHCMTYLPATDLFVGTFENSSWPKNMKKVPSGSHLTEAQVVLGHRNWDMGLTPHDVMQTEFEWATIRFQQAFERYCMQIAHISGLGELSFPELILLHVMGLQDGPITSGLLARQINAEGVANIQYSLRKLESYHLFAKTRVTGGNTQAYELT